MERQKTDPVTLVLLCAVVLMGGYIFTSQNGNSRTEYERKIDSLDVVVSNLELQQLAKDSALVYYKYQLDSLGIEKKAVEREINDVRQFYSKAIKDIGKLSITQLDSFFTARYDRTGLHNR